MSRTLILVKPDAFERALTGEVIARFERKGLRIAALKKMQADEEIANEHYAEHTEKPFFGELVAFITGGPLVAMVLEGARSGPGRAPADRRDQPGRGRARLDPRRLRARGDLQHGPRLRLGRVGRARDRDLVSRAVVAAGAAGVPLEMPVAVRVRAKSRDRSQTPRRSHGSGHPDRSAASEILGSSGRVRGRRPRGRGAERRGPEVEVVENARRKARGRRAAPALVIACDTEVVLDGKALGKARRRGGGAGAIWTHVGPRPRGAERARRPPRRRGAQRARADRRSSSGSSTRPRRSATSRSASGGGAPAATRSRRSARPWSSGSRAASRTSSACRSACSFELAPRTASSRRLSLQGRFRPHLG